MIILNDDENFFVAQTQNFFFKKKIAIFCDDESYKKVNSQECSIIFYINKEIKITEDIEYKIFHIKNFCKYSKPFTTIIKDYFNNIDKTNIFIYGKCELDYKFALNCNLNYIGEKYAISYPIDLQKKYQEYNFNLLPKEKDMIILVGYQGSGKSTLANYIKNKYDYFILSIDDYIFKKNILLLSKIENIIQNNNKIIIDYFCLKPIRKKFIDLGRKYNYNIRVIILNYDLDIIKHNSYYRFLKEEREIANIFYDVIFDLTCDKNESVDEILYFNEIFSANDTNYYKYMY